MPTDRSNQVTPTGDWNMLSGSSFDELITKIKRNKPLAGQNITTEETKDGVVINFTRNTGACCILEVCSVTTENDCANSGGIFQGVNTVCDPNPCIPTGACCYDDGSCSIEIESDCDDVGGIYQGNDTVCDPNPCPPTGACCYEDGTCDLLTESDCDDVSGNWQGPDTDCEDSICLGACCYPDGGCFGDMTKADCENSLGVFQDFQSDCGPPNPCPQPICCGYSAFDGSGRVFRTKTYVHNRSQGICCRDSDNATCNTGITSSGSRVSTVDPFTCAETTSGSIIHSALFCDGTHSDTTVTSTYTGPWDSTSATTLVFDHTVNVSCAGCLKDPTQLTDHIEMTLSGECIP